MSKSTSGAHQQNDNTFRSDFPPPYSPSAPHHQHHQQQPTQSIPTSPVSSHDEVVPSYNPACAADPSAPSLYPAIPQQVPHQPLGTPHHHHPPAPSVSFPMPQPYNPPTHYNPPPGGHYGTIHYHNHTNPPPAGFHTIHIPHYRPHHPVVTEERRFPIGALLFVFGWMFPPLWILGACCCASSRNPYEAWWARLNLVMALLLLVSSIVYSMLAMLAGDWWVSSVLG